MPNSKVYMNKIVRAFVRRARARGIELTNDEVRDMLEELMDKVRLRCKLREESDLTTYLSLLEAYLWKKSTSQGQ